MSRAMSEGNGNMFPHVGDGTGESDPTTIFTTTSSQRLDTSQQTSSSSLKQKWRIRPSTPYKQAALVPLSNNPQEDTDKLSVSSNSMNNNELSTSFLSLSGATAAGQTDDPHHKQTATPRKSMLASKSNLSKFPDIEEMKSVKFKKLDDCPDSHGFRSTGKKSRVWPVDSETNIGTTKPQRSIRTVIVDICFGCRRHSQAKANQAPTSNDNASKKPDNHTDDNDSHSSTPRRQGLCRCSDLSTQRGRRKHAMLIMLMAVIPVLALLIQNSIDLSEHRSQLDIHESVKERILFSVGTGNVIHQTQIERGMSALYISSQGNPEIKKSLLQAYTETDRAIERLTYWIVEPGYSHLQSIESYHDWIKQFREQVLNRSIDNVTAEEVISFYSEDNEIITRWMGSSIQQSKSGDLWKALVGYYMLILSKELAGVERALGSIFYTQGGFNKTQMLIYLQRKILGETYLNRCMDYSISISTFLQDNFIGQETDVSIKRMRVDITQNTLNGSDVEMGSFWFWNMTLYINVLKEEMSKTEENASKQTTVSLSLRTREEYELLEELSAKQVRITTV